MSADPVLRMTIKCGCVVAAHPRTSIIGIEYCTVHAAAPDLLAALETAQEAVCSEYCTSAHHSHACMKASEAIAKVREVKP